MPRAASPSVATYSALVALVVLVAAACGNGGDDGDAATTTSTVAAATTTTVEVAPTSPGSSTTTPGPTTTTTPTEVDVCADPDLSEMAFVFNTSPAAGETVSSGFTASGCANAFEANVAWRLEDRSGSELASGFTTATCGTGCVGTYSFEVAYSVPGPTIGQLLVFTTSPRDGSETDVNSIPLILT